MHPERAPQQLRKQRVNQTILAGMVSNLCVKSHLREFFDVGLEVAIVREAVAGAKLPEGGGYLAVLINFRFIVNGHWATDEVISRLYQKV